MANIMNAQKSTLKNQRTVAAYKAEVEANEVYIKPLVTKEGVVVTNKYGHQVVVFIMAKNGIPVAQGIVADKTAQEGINPTMAQVAESHYITEAGEPKVAMMLFNGINVMEGAIKVEGL